MLLAMDTVPITGSNTSKGKDDAGMAVNAVDASPSASPWNSC